MFLCGLVKSNMAMWNMVTLCTTYKHQQELAGVHVSSTAIFGISILLLWDIHTVYATTITETQQNVRQLIFKLGENKRDMAKIQGLR